MQDIHSIAAAVRAANARNVARAGRQLPIRKILTVRNLVIDRKKVCLIRL